MTVGPIPPLSPGAAAALTPALAGDDPLAAIALRTVDAAQVFGSASAPPAQPTSASVLETAVQSAATQQSGLGSLMANLAVALARPDLPAPVQAAAADVLALQQPLNHSLTAADVKQALIQSGLLLEAKLADPGTTLGPDLKAALLSLGQALEAWEGAAPELAEASAAPVPDPPRTAAEPPVPPPPYRGGPVLAQGPAVASLGPDAAGELVVRRLLHETGGAVARQVLLQAASLADGPRPAGETEGAQWMFELPFVTPQGSAVAQFEIGRESAPTGGEDDERAWRTRFSLNAEPMGAVHANIVLNGDRARVTLWAERGGTAARLNDQGSELARALQAESLVASVTVHPGAPVIAAPAAGRFVDRSL